MTTLLLLAALAVVLALWGLTAARTPADYFAAGRRAGVWLVGVAGTAAGVSAFTFVGGPGLFAVAGAGSLWMILSAPVTGALQCWAVGEPVVRLARRHGVVTVPSLLQLRAGLPAQGAAAVVLAVGAVASLAVQAKAAAVLGEAFLGVGGTTAAVAVLAATAAYTAAGGMRAGLVADAVQGAVMAAVALVVAVAAVAAAGGPGEAVRTLAAARPQLLGAFGPIPPAQAYAWYLLFCLGTLAQPHYLQKFLFLRDERQLRLLPAVLTGALAATLTVWLGVGLGGAALVARGAVTIAFADELAPVVVAHLGPWAVALAGVAALAALMSTSASFLNLAAAALTRDLPAALRRPPLPLWTAGLATLVIAATATAVALASQRAVAMLGLIGWGFFTAALLPALVVGLAWEGARPAPTVVAMVAGGLVDLLLETLRPSLPPGFEPGLAGAAVGTVVLVAGSCLRRSGDVAVAEAP